MNRILPLALLATLAASLAQAQDDTQGWFQLTFNRREANGIRYFGEAQLRIGEDVSRSPESTAPCTPGRSPGTTVDGHCLPKGKCEVSIGS